MNRPVEDNPQTVANLSVYGLAHAAVDATCAGVLFSISAANLVSQELFFLLIVAYGVIAFALQPVVGLISDHYRQPKNVALLGMLLTALGALAIPISPAGGVLTAALGNALFHVGGGTISLNLTRYQATAPGIFVAPGALGLLAGVMIGKSGGFTPLPFVLALAVISALMLCLKMPRIDYDREKRAPADHLGLVILLLFFAVAIRAAVGSLAVFPWKSDVSLLIILTAGIALGKALGGILGDKFGWSRVAVASLAVSAPLLAFSASSPPLAIFGMLLFNFAMPITLTAMANAIPGRPGFAFGLTCLALIMGALPAYGPWGALFGNGLLTLTVTLLAALLIYQALKIFGKQPEDSEESETTLNRKSALND